MRPTNLITFEQAATQLAITESDLDDLIDAGKLTTQPYLGDVYLLTDQVAALTTPRPTTDKPAPKPRPSPDDAKLARIHDLQATGVRAVRAAQAAELLKVRPKYMSRLGNEGRVNFHIRNGRRWYLLEDVETYARLQNVWASKSGGWTPYGKLDEGPTYLDLSLVSPAKPKAVSETSPPIDDDYRIESRQAAQILNVCVRYCHTLCKQNGIKPEPVLRKLPHREKRWNRRIVRQFWSYSAREIFALAAQREQKKSRSNSSPKDWNERGRKPFIRTKIEAPPGDTLLTRAEAAVVLGICRSGVSNLVTRGRLFGWQTHPGKHGCPLYLSARQVIRYRDDPDRLKRRAAVNRGRRPQSPLGQETEGEIWLENNGMAAKLRYAEKTNEDRQHGEFFNTRQAAKLLGITPSSLHGLRQRGRINAYQKPRRKWDGGGKKWWFYRKDDIYDLLANSEYLRYHKRCQAAKLRSLGRWIPETEPTFR